MSSVSPRSLLLISLAALPLVLLVLFLPAASVTAAVTVQVENVVVDSIAQGEITGSPRQHVLAMESGALAVFVAGWRGRNLFLNPDGGKDGGWIDTLDMTFGPPMSNADNHTQFSTEGDTLWAVLPMTGGDSLLVKMIGVSPDSLWNIDYSYTRGYRAPGGWGHTTVYRGGAWFIPGTDSMILVSRGHDGDGNDYMDIMSFVSTDRGRTWGDSIRVVDLRDAPDQTRIGSFNYFNSTVSAIVFSRKDDGVLWYNWDRTLRRWVGEAENPLTGSFDRGYSADVIDDTIQFVTCANTGVSDRDTVYYAWKTRSETSWHRGAFQAGTISTAQWIRTELCYVEASSRLVVFYQQFYANALDSMQVFCRYWIPELEMWSEPTLVSSGRGVRETSPALRVPASHGDVAYVGYRQYNAVTGADEIELGIVSFAETVDTCSGCVGTVGNLDCDPGDEVSLGDLSVLIDHLFVSFDPVCCPAESNLDDQPGVALGDLTVLIDHLFVTFAPLPPCP